MKPSFTYHQTNGVGYLKAAILENKRLVHAFTTREGGVSEGPLSTLNLGLGRDDKPEHVLENYRRICSILGVDQQRCIMAKQVHSTKVQIVTEKDAGKGIQYPQQRMEVDGLVTDQPGLPLVVFYADCVPILLYHERTHCLAVVHAGWKGTVGAIAAEAVRMMQQMFRVETKEILAAIGPSIGSCHFEVGQEVAREFQRNGFHSQILPSPSTSEKWYVNLWDSNRKVLLDAGLMAKNITCAEICTVCHKEHYFSHRGLGADTGRMALIAALC